MTDSKILDNVIKTRRILEDLLSLDRLEKLADKNQFIAMAYAEALMHVNYHLLSWDAPTKMTVTSGAVVPIPTTKDFPATIEGKLAAIGQSFAHSAGKLDNLLGTAAVQQMLSAAGMAADIAKAVLSATKVSQRMKK